MKKLRHRLKLIWLKRKWVIQSVFNTKGFLRARDLLELEKSVQKMYHKAKREDDKKELLKSEGRLEIIKWLKDV